MNILIVEDEPLVAAGLARMVHELEPGSVIMGPLGSVKETRQWLSSHPLPDLILSDIQLSDGISLDIFSAEEPACPIIFTTAYDEYAIRAFKMNSIDYLLKPIDRKELQSAFHKFHLLQSKYSNDQFLKQIMEVFRNFNSTNKYKERFAVHQGRTVLLVPAESVAFFLKEELIYLVDKEGKKYITDYRSLEEIVEHVDPRLFFRANRQHFVQIDSIEGFRIDESGKIHIKMRNIKVEGVVISKEKAPEFRNWFDK
jgi:two-component system LytT family response regulator